MLRSSLPRRKALSETCTKVIRYLGKMVMWTNAEKYKIRWGWNLLLI